MNNTIFGILLIVASLALVAQAAPSTELSCPSTCSGISTPVCAYNGKCHRTFGSSCNLAADNCLNRGVEGQYFENNLKLNQKHLPISEFNFKHNGECEALEDNICSISGIEETQEIPVVDTKCNLICTFIYRPVCAYNGTCYQTFPNSCVLDSSNCVNRSQASKFFYKLSYSMKLTL